MSVRSSILERQRLWAVKAGHTPDSRGYLRAIEENLWTPMSSRTRAAFQNGSGAELKSKMRALHSSSALAVNFFDYWSRGDAKPLADALGLPSAIAAIEFEAQQPTGLDGNPPNLDLCLTLANDLTIAIESKFCEWLSRKSAAKEHFKPKYFPEGQELWSRVGLPQCQRLAEDVRNRSDPYLYLDVPQLLKHSLGLASQLQDRFDLYYLYFDCLCREGTAHRSEIERFAARVGSEIRFKALTYQDVFRKLRTTGATADCIDYLEARYFGDDAEPPHAPDRLQRASPASAGR